VVLLLAVAGGCKRDDADRLVRVGRKVAGKVDNLSGHAQEKLVKALNGMTANLDDGALGARVTERLRWDRSLGGAQIEVHTTGPVVELRGTTGTEEQRKRAVELAETTAGVERVIDGLSVPGPH
jgi:osmotically-inducible protein OsmY